MLANMLGDEAWLNFGHRLALKPTLPIKETKMKNDKSLLSGNVRF
jgi:hypothetical protein